MAGDVEPSPRPDVSARAEAESGRASASSRAGGRRTDRHQAGSWRVGGDTLPGAPTRPHPRATLRGPSKRVIASSGAAWLHRPGEATVTRSLEDRLRRRELSERSSPWASRQSRGRATGMVGGTRPAVFARATQLFLWPGRAPPAATLLGAARSMSVDGQPGTCAPKHCRRNPAGSNYRLAKPRRERRVSPCGPLGRFSAALGHSFTADSVRSSAR